MSKIKDKVRDGLVIYLGVWLGDGENRCVIDDVVDDILNPSLFTEIAIVDRNAKPPTLGDESHTDDYVDGHIRARKDMIEKGWVFEVK